MFAAATAAAAWHARRELPTKSTLANFPGAVTITGAGIRAPTDAFEGIEEHEPPPPVTPVWDMKDYVQLDSPQVENLTISPAQLSDQLATQHHNDYHSLHNPPTSWTPAELQTAMQTATTTMMTTTTTTGSSGNPNGAGGSDAYEGWCWDLSPASSPGQSVFPSTTDLTSSTARSSAVFSHFSLSPLVHQFGSLPSEPPQDNIISDNTNPIVYAHTHTHTHTHASPHQHFLPSQFIYGPSAESLPAAWPPAPLSHTLPIAAQHDISAPDPTPSAAIPIPAASSLYCQHHISFANTDFNFSQPPASPRSHFDSSPPSRSLIGFGNEQYGPVTVGDSNANPVMTQQPLAPAATSLPDASELAAHMSHLHGVSASSGPPFVSSGQGASVQLQGWRAGRRDKSQPPPLSRNSTITQKSLPAALQAPAPLVSSLPIHSQSPFTSPSLPTRSPIFPVNTDGSPQPPQLLFVNQTAQFSTATGSPPSQGEGHGPGFAALEEQGYSSMLPLRVGRGQKKRKRLLISEEPEDDFEDRKISDGESDRGPCPCERF